jgi:hypothetical protein
MADVDKGLYAAPKGMEQLAEEEQEIEIEIVDPEEVTIKTRDMEITIDPDAMEEDEFSQNLAEELSDKYMEELASDLLEDFSNDVNSRKDWLETYVDGLELLGLKIEQRSEPWEGACAVYHPLLSEALVKFQAETMMETFPAAGPVKTSIIGKETPECIEAAQRVQENMNYQLMDMMPEYRPEHERMLWGLGLAGNAFKKVYYDPSLERQVSLFVPAEDMVVPYGASNLETAPRITHVMRKTKQEIHNLQQMGFYRDIDLGDAEYDLEEVEKKIAEQMGFDATKDDRYKILEMNVDLDLEGYEDEDDGEKTGIARPYIVTIDKGTSEILSIRRNWNQFDESKKRREHFVHYGYVPGFGFYCFGLIHLIGGFAKSGTMLLRQLVDAGTLSNLPGGFKARGLRIKGDDTPIGPGEWRDVDAPSGTIRDNLMPLPYKEPSQVLALLMDKIIEEGRRFASAADMKVSDMSANSPVGSTLAILERTLKVMSAVNARVYYSMKKEFGLLKNIIRDYTDPNYRYDPSTGTPGAKQDDYNKVNLIPVADPNAATMAQKVVQYQAVMQMAQQNPDIYDLPELNRQMLDVLGVKNANKLIPNKDEAKPVDPVSENMNMLNSKPVQAFIYQDHQAHIATHMAFKQDPQMAAVIGQGPKAAQVASALEAHLAEHLAFQYRKQLEEQLGVPLPAPNEDLPEDVELEVARLAARAGQQLLASQQAQAQQQQAAQQQQDPLIQMQQQELQIKQMEAQAKAQKMQADTQLDMAKLELEKQKLEINSSIKTTELVAKTELDGAKLELEAAIAEEELNYKTETAVADNMAKGLSMTMAQQDKASKLELDKVKLMQEDNKLMQQNLIKNADREASLMLKASDLDLRENESQLDNATKVNVTKLKDETKLNERE